MESFEKNFLNEDGQHYVQTKVKWWYNDNRQFAVDIRGIESDIIRMLAEVTASAVS